MSQFRIDIDLSLSLNECLSVDMKKWVLLQLFVHFKVRFACYQSCVNRMKPNQFVGSTSM